jgi:MFS transporter, DHA2 family, multidrug resistance protein
MFRDRNFATASFMMLALGLVLYGSTVLLPQYLQIVMGYSAQQAGMVLSPGGLVVMVLMPFVGALTPRVNPRVLIGFGFAALSLSLFYMTRHLYPGMDFGTALRLRAYQSVGLAFLFVPINTLIYEGIPPEKNNVVSGIVNLARNMGGDIGIAFVTTMAARRTQFHQARLTDHTSRYDHAFGGMLDAVTHAMERAGVSSAAAAHRALAVLYRQTIIQATTLAYLDVLHSFALVAAAMIPFLWLAHRRRGAAPARPAMGHP